jgi:hypothetical protein
MNFIDPIVIAPQIDMHKWAGVTIPYPAYAILIEAVREERVGGKTFTNGLLALLIKGVCGHKYAENMLDKISQMRTAAFASLFCPSARIRSAALFTAAVKWCHKLSVIALRSCSVSME